jgi:hypothetical protein
MSTRKSRSKPRRPSPKKADAKLVRENEELRRERDESLARETATSDILRMIARSPAQLPIMGQCQAFVLTYYQGREKGGGLLFFPKEVAKHYLDKTKEVIRWLKQDPRLKRS